MKIELAPDTKKQFYKLPKPEAKKVLRKLLAIETNPFEGKKLKGEYAENYSFRAWPYRIIYEIHENKVIITAIEHRQSTYKH